MRDPEPTTPMAESDSEAFEALKQIAGRRTLPIPTDLLVRHVLALPGPWNRPVRRHAARLAPRLVVASW
jgi:hypothetical protein